MLHPTSGGIGILQLWAGTARSPAA